MLEFYEFNTVNICIVLISIFIIYNIFSKCFKDKTDKKKLNIDHLLIAVVLSFIISLIISYFLTANEEKLLNDNYWDPIEEL